MEKRLFIASDRLPLLISGEGRELKVSRQTDGIITAAVSHLQINNDFSEVFWTGVPGCSPAVWMRASERVPELGFLCLPVPLYKKKYKGYYSGFCNSVLTPILYSSPRQGKFEQDYFNDYLQVNEQFAEVMLRRLRPGDTVWIHDYHLMPLAGYLHRNIPELSISFFFHAPFPAFDEFRYMPSKWLTTLITGMLGADLIGFYTVNDTLHFLETVQMALGIDNNLWRIRCNNRLVQVNVFPPPIDLRFFRNARPMDSSSRNQTGDLLQNNWNVRKYNLSVWLEDSFSQLEEIKQKQESFQMEFMDGQSRINILDAYRNAEKRLFLLDYDGTLVPFADTPELSTPGENLIHLLYQLCAVKDNEVFLVSGKSSEWLQRYFGDLPLNLVAEHGACTKLIAEGWTIEAKNDGQWKENVVRIMEKYVNRCAGSFVEEKEFSVVWHYRNTDKSLAQLCAAELNRSRAITI